MRGLWRAVKQRWLTWRQQKLGSDPGATEGGKTRKQVRAELIEAWRMGDIPVLENGLTPRELNPGAYPSRPAEQGSTKEQVQAELAEASRMGEWPVLDDGRTPRDLNPAIYPSRAVVQGKTRAQVKAELVEAVRLGDVMPPGDHGMTLRGLFPERYPVDQAVERAESLSDRSDVPRDSR